MLLCCGLVDGCTSVCLSVCLCVSLCQRFLVCGRVRFFSFGSRWMWRGCVGVTDGDVCGMRYAVYGYTVCGMRCDAWTGLDWSSMISVCKYMCDIGD